MVPTSLVLLLLTAPRAEDARLLMLGNSYTAANDLHELAADTLAQTVTSWTEVYARPLTQGGTTLAEHASKSDGSQGDTEWRLALVTGEDAGTWDWVVLQDQSQVPGFPQTSGEWLASRDGAVLLDGMIEDGGGETVFLLTWGRRDGDSYNPSRYPDFLTMQEQLTEGYLAYAEACGEDGSPAWIIPAGLAFQQVYDGLVDEGVDPTEGTTAFTALYQDDGSHPAPAGSWLAALTAAAAITGRTVANVSAPAEVQDELQDRLRGAADASVLDDPFGAIPYRWAYEWDEWQTPAELTVDDGVVISGVDLRPTVRVNDDESNIGALAVGSTHEGDVEGAGRLWIQDGGVLAADTLSIGQSECTLRVDGGRLDIAEIWNVGSQDAIELDGGWLELGTGSLPGLRHLSGGLGIAGTLTMEADYALPVEGSLQIDVVSLEGPLLDIEGTGTLAGSLTVTLDDALREEGGNVELIRADTLEVGDIEATLPADTELELHHYEDGDVLVLNWLYDCGACDTGEAVIVSGDCGCAAQPRRVQTFLLVLVIGATLRSRRRDWPCARPQIP